MSFSSWSRPCAVAMFVAIGLQVLGATAEYLTLVFIAAWGRARGQSGRSCTEAEIPSVIGRSPSDTAARVVTQAAGEQVHGFRASRT